MSWLDDISNDDQRKVEELRKPGTTGKVIQQEKGLFDQAISAPFRGVAAGAVKVLDTAVKPLEGIKDAVVFAYNDDLDGALDVRKQTPRQYNEEQNKERKSRLVGVVENLEDKENTGFVGNIGFGIGDFATRAVIGGLVGGLPGAVATTGLSETNYNYDNLTEKGVDSSTALKVAAIDGVVAGASAALPISYGFKGTGGLIKDAALSVGGATALSTGGQAISGKILKSNNYDKEAKKYEVTAESFATDIALNALLFGGARGASYLKSKKVNADIAAEVNSLDIDTIEAKNTQIEATLEVNKMQLDDIAPARISDPIQQNNHYKNLDTATEQIRTGRPVNVAHPVKGEEKQKAVNYESMAIPSNAKTIARKAQQEGIDPSVALTIAQLESNFSHTAQPPVGKDGKRLSTAYGLFQPLDKTWKGLGGGDKNNIDEQIRIGLKHIKQADSYMRKSLGREPVAHEQYLGHLLGPGGASAVLKADPNAKLIDIVRKYDSKNADAIVNNNGMSGMSVGQAIDKWRKKWNTVSARYGGNGTSHAVGMDGSNYDMAYEVKSLDDLIASNDAAYGVNPNYPSEFQPRDRTREAYRQQIENMANDLRPELLGESYKLSDGAPIIGMDNVVESGNGRTMAIGKAYEQGKGEAYRQFVNDFADARGFDISGVNNPVLVRTRLTDTDRVQFSRLANESDVAQFSATERAASDADRLPDSSLLNINNDGNINLDQSMDFVRGFVDSLPKSEQGSVITADGRLSQDGKRRIESALTQRAYGDSSLVARLSENLDDDSKTILNALLRAAPQLAQLGDLVKQGGRHSNTIAQDLAQAAQKLSDLKANGQTVPDYLNQGQLLDDGLSSGAKGFLNVFDSNKRSAKAISDNIQNEINRIEGMGDPRQGSLFGDGPEERAALDIIMNNPDQEISVSRVRPDGEIEEITMTLRERLDELEAEAKQAQQDQLAAETAISCALQFGE